MEKMAVILDGAKLTTDVGAEVCFQLGKEEVNRFYTAPQILAGKTNKGLGWLQEQFHRVSWSSLDKASCSKPEMFQVWLSKQCINICATQLNMA